MSIGIPTDVGSELKTPDSGVKIAKAQSAGAINGPWIDKTGFESMKAIGALGAAAGTPTTQSLKLKIQDATDNSGSGAADYKPDGSNVAQSTTGAAADNGVTTLSVNLKNSRQWFRIVGTLAFTGGTSPTNDVVLVPVLGGARDTPVAETNG